MSFGLLASESLRAMSSKAPPVVPPGRIVEVTSKENFDQLVSGPSALVVAYFTAAWCGPCRAMQPVLESLAKKHQDAVSIVKLDIDNADIVKVVQSHGISSVPTYFFYKGGKVSEKFTGARKDLLEAAIGKLLAAKSPV